MGRFQRICLAGLAAGLIAKPGGDAGAQTAKIVIEAMSASRLAARGLPAWPVTSGLRVVGRGTPVYLSADTSGQGTGLSFSWSLVSVPNGSTAAIDSPANQFVKFVADSSGIYGVRLTVGSSTADTTVFASRYVGVDTAFPGCALGCHTDKVSAWQATEHASMFLRGISGQLAVDPTTGKGVYSPDCVACHTTAWIPAANNGNFGYLAHNGSPTFDTTWYHAYTLVNGVYQIPFNDSTAIKLLENSYPDLVPVATIGCESCHGPGGDHYGQAQNIALSVEAGVCAQCHDAPPRYMTYTEWSSSLHAAFPAAQDAKSTSCFPCHSGTAFMKLVDTVAATGKPPVTWSTAADGGNHLTCAECHNPHGGGNPDQLRTVSVLLGLKNGYHPAAGDGGKGQLCMNCHQARYNVAARVTNLPPLYGFADHYGPHNGPQADMFFGQNGYQYGDTSFTGVRTHGGVPDACVTCHMGAGGHTWSMVDSLGDDITTPCQPCHGAIASFDDVRASYDYDGNGRIEGVQTEIQGLLDRLKARLPIDVTTGEPTTAIKDSSLIKGHPEYVQGIYDYYFVKNDGSMGVHNAKYAVSLLQKALGLYPLDVSANPNAVPAEFALDQNYPNPFNPSTNITFELPREEYVRIDVYDLTGRRISTLVSTLMNAGTFTVTWKGEDQEGARVSSGVYLCRMQAGSFSSTRKMLLVK